MPGPVSPSGGREPTGRPPGQRLLRARFWVYGIIVVALLLLRVIPGIRAHIARRPSAEHRMTLTLAGMDLAPGLIPRLADDYRQLYPEIAFRMRNGGTRQALEDLFNRRADIAFTSRPMTPEEESIVRAAGDTALCFPVALGGIAVLASQSAPIDSLDVGDLRRILQGERPTGEGRPIGWPIHVYAPDPNLGLWTALTGQLGIPDSTAAPVTWLAGDLEVVQAVAADPHGIGVASTLALPADLDRRGARALAVHPSRASAAEAPSEGAVAGGTYPLYHYLYVSCRPDGGALASGFVSFLYSGKGQRLVEREGFLPAREVPREIELSRKPLVKVG